jgi:hypothetical protein
MWQCSEKEEAKRCGSSGLKSRGRGCGAVVRVRMSCRRRLPMTAIRVGDARLVDGGTVAQVSVAGNTVDTVGTNRDRSAVSGGGQR